MLDLTAGQSDDPAALGLPVVGFALVALANAAYAVYLWRAGLLRRPLDRAALPFFAAVLATLAWGAMSLVDLGSTKRFTWHLALLFDQCRYAAWVAFLLVLLRPMAGGLPDWRTRLGIALPVALAGLGLGANAVLGFASPAAADAGLRACWPASSAGRSTACCWSSRYFAPD